MGDTGNGFSLQDLITMMSRMTPQAPPPPPDPKRAKNYGEKAVREELGVTGRKLPEEIRAGQEGRQAVAAELSPARAEGTAAVADATRPAAIREIINALMRQAGWTSPEESAAWAQGVGQRAVGEAVLPTPQPMPITPPGAPQLGDPERAHFQGTGAVAEELGLPRQLRRPSTPEE
jgi:hypothetical protein